MTLFLLKPVHWNTNDYTKPSGHVINNDSYPGKNGFGHEEWNNSPRMTGAEAGKTIKFFHTEGVGNADVSSHEADIFVFLYASHNGIQQLVGVAGNASCLISDDDRRKREKVTRDLSLDNLENDVWQLPLVRQRFSQNRNAFLVKWRSDLHWIPNWVCDEENYFSPRQPVLLNPFEITGKSKLNPRFKSYTNIDRSTAVRIMGMVPQQAQDRKWKNIFSAITSDQTAIIDDLSELAKLRLSATERQIQALARIGQGAFRARLLERWANACAVSGCRVSETLRASHVKPWCLSTPVERLDPSNGILLVASLDALFDRGLISFESSGNMIVSSLVSQEDRQRLGIPASLREGLTSSEKAFLAYHREQRFQP